MSDEDMGYLPIELMMPGDLMVNPDGSLAGIVAQTELDPNARKWTIHGQGGLDWVAPLGAAHLVVRPEP